MRIILLLIYLLAAWRWGDWLNWEKYYPTILYFIVGNFLYGYLCYNYPLWLYHQTPDMSFLPNNTIISIVLSFTAFPCAILLYLSHFPHEKSYFKQLIYIILWVCLFSGIEYLMKKMGSLSYHNGWNMGWSILFDFVLFHFLILHLKKPLLTWLFSFIFIIILSLIFKVPIKSMR